MKKKQYIRFLYGLCCLGMAVLLLFMVPSQSWAEDGDIDCQYLFATQLYVNSDNDPYPDTDWDGYSDWMECRNYYGDGQTVQSMHYFGNSEAVSGVLNPNEAELFVVMTEEDDPYLIGGDVLEYFKQLESTGITVHEVSPNLVGDINDVLSPNYLRVFQEDPQKALRLRLSGKMPSNWDGDCANVPSPLIVGAGNWGTPMDPKADATVYTRRIEKKVRCMYAKAGNVDPDNPQMLEDIATYIKHTVAHELLHNLNGRLLYPLDYNTDARAYDKNEGAHYSERDETIMSSKVEGSVKGGTVKLPIGTIYEPQDAEYARYFLTFPPAFKLY